MTWDPNLKRAADKPPRDWRDNAEILQEFVRYMAKNNYANNTREHYECDLRVFTQMWGDTLVTTLADQDIQAFVDKMSEKCKYLVMSKPNECRVKLPVAGCPLLTGANPSSCPKFKALLPSGVLSYVRSINSLYNFLFKEGYIKWNPAAPVLARYLDRHRQFLDDRIRMPDQRKMKDDEVRLLVRETPIHIGVVVMLQAKGFMRIHEAIKTSRSPKYLNLEEGWLDIPRDWNYGNKRQGVNHRMILDAEARSMLRRYLVWWEKKVKRDEQGNPLTDKLIITTFGLPWCKNGFANNFKMQLHKHCRQLGLMTGRETERAERVNTHAFRAWACSWAAAHGAEPGQVRVLKGDKMPGTLDQYDDQMRRLPDLYARFGPVLKV